MSDKVLTELADALAADTIKAMDTLGDDRLFEEVAKVLGASSQTSEEAFMTSIRIRLAERRARRFLEDHVRTTLESRGQTGDGASRGEALPEG
ncbi:hypothetical protein [Citreimonas salinaria]|uniref:Uncharacterized protein n=1 Tax=Citreimonas salinaria TaxID=321339 RepID=A0A1H3G467_9RHOB|nr:hypothetical protein [Citreimonas salinaria]SDX97900.1 hypothetical protein SAMN05444340_102142 [Citreimonas salinaria]